MPLLHGPGRAAEDGSGHRDSRPQQVPQRGRDQGLRLEYLGHQLHGGQLPARPCRGLQFLAGRAHLRALRRGHERAALRHAGQKNSRILRAPQRLRLLQRALRGRDHQPGAPLPRDQLRRDEEHLRGVHGQRALPGVRRQAPAPGGPERHRGRAVHPGSRRDDGAQGPGLRGGPAADPQGGADRPPAAQGDHRAAELPGQRGSGLPDPRPQRGHPLRRRGPAHPPGHPDRLGTYRRALHSGRAVHRPAPVRQRKASEHAAQPARPGQHADRGGARRGNHAGGGLHRGHRPRRRRERRTGRGLRHPRGGHGEPRVPHRAVPLRCAQGSAARKAPQAQWMADREGRTGQQPEEHRRVLPAGRALLRHRRVRQRQELPGQ